MRLELGRGCRVWGVGIYSEVCFSVEDLGFMAPAVACEWRSEDECTCVPTGSPKPLCG